MLDSEYSVIKSDVLERRDCITHSLVFRWIQLNMLRETQWLSDLVLDSKSKNCRLEPYQMHCVVSFSKTLYPLLSTTSIQEDLS